MIAPSIIKVWFSHACSQMQGVVQGRVYLGEPDTGPFNCVEVYADAAETSDVVRENISAALKRRKSIVTRIGSAKAKQVANAESSVTGIDSKNLLVTSPVIIDRQLHGAVSIEFKHDPSIQNQNNLQQVEAAINWLGMLSKTEVATEGNQNAGLALQVAALALSHETSSSAAAAVATELATRLSCERVSIGFIEGRVVRLYALSHSSRYEAKQNLIQHIEAAVEESVAQKETLVYPDAESSPHRLQAQADLARNHGTEYIATVPMVHNENVLGAIVFERTRQSPAFDAATVELCEQLASLFAPILEFRRLNDRPFTVRARESVRSSVASLFGRGHLGIKFGSALVVAVFLLLFFMQWEYKVSADAVLEGTIERVITAPEEGYIKDATARPGDVVKAEQVLASLDDRDLQLEKLKWSGKQKQISKEYREALASYERSQIGILRAQLDQAEVQLEILDKKLNRTLITAPIDGVVVSGDFTRALGSPVERGQILYKVSPLDQYRVLLNVDESDVSEISVGMKGELTLSAAAEDTYDITIDRITPVSVSGDGINYFQVEASLAETPEFLRPGMQGVSKIAVGERPLLWIWTHKMVDWLRLRIWAWW